MKRIGIRWPYAAQRKRRLMLIRKRMALTKLPRISELNAGVCDFFWNERKAPQNRCEQQSIAKQNQKCRIGSTCLWQKRKDRAGNPERERAEKEQLHEQEVRQEEENKENSR